MVSSRVSAAHGRDHKEIGPRGKIVAWRINCARFVLQILHTTINNDKMFDPLPIEQRLFLYGDAAYHPSPCILGAFIARGRDLYPYEKLYNLHMSRCRISVEHSFKEITQFWRHNSHALELKIGRIVPKLLSKSITN